MGAAALKTDAAAHSSAQTQWRATVAARLPSRNDLSDSQLREHIRGQCDGFVDACRRGGPLETVKVEADATRRPHPRLQIKIGAGEGILHQVVMDIVGSELGAAQDSFASEAATFQSSLLGDVLDVGAGFDPIRRSRCEQVLGEQSLSECSDTLPTGDWQYGDAEIPGL